MLDKLTREEVGRLVGAAGATIGTWQTLGLIPASGGLTRTQALAVAVGRGLVARGLPLAQAAEAMNYLWHLPLESLEAHFAREARYIAIFGPEVLVPRLIDLEAITRNPDVPAQTAVDAGLVPVLVDAKRVWDRLNDEVSRMRGRKGACNASGS